jgi:hypothetical protein
MKTLVIKLASIIFITLTIQQTLWAQESFVRRPDFIEKQDQQHLPYGEEMQCQNGEPQIVALEHFAEYVDPRIDGKFIDVDTDPDLFCQYMNHGEALPSSIEVKDYFLSKSEQLVRIRVGQHALYLESTNGKRYYHIIKCLVKTEKKI